MIVKINGMKLFYEKCGTGPALLMLHGNAQSHRIFDIAAKALSEHFTVYLPDSRGHGKSGRARELSYDDMAADMAGFIDTAIGEKCAVYGFSDGGIVALLLAMAYPEKLSQIIISGANTRPEGLKAIAAGAFRFLAAFEKKGNKKKMLLTQPDITTEQLKRIRIPVHVLAGSHDLIREENTRLIADSIPGATLEILPGEGHSSYVVHSRKLAPLLKKYLK